MNKPDRKRLSWIRWLMVVAILVYGVLAYLTYMAGVFVHLDRCPDNVHILTTPLALGASLGFGLAAIIALLLAMRPFKKSLLKWMLFVTMISILFGASAVGVESYTTGAVKAFKKSVVFTTENSLIRTQSGSNRVESVVVNGTVTSTKAPLEIEVPDRCNAWHIIPAIQGAKKQIIEIKEPHVPTPYEVEFVPNQNFEECFIHDEGTEEYQSVAGTVSLNTPGVAYWKSSVAKTISFELSPKVQSTKVVCCTAGNGCPVSIPASSFNYRAGGLPW